MQRRTLSRFLILHVAIAMLALASSCDRPPKLSPLPKNAVILAFGDSLTFGTGAPSDQSYPAILAETTGLHVINAGIPGELSGEGLRRLPETLEKHRPDLVILCHGGNDILRRLNSEKTAENISAMVTLARDRGAEVLLLAVPEPGLWLSPAPFYAAISQNLEIPCDQDVLAEVLSDRHLKSDRVHPNAAGYHQMAESIMSALDDYGAL